MGSSRRPSRGKKINPHFWVFCEGETEEAYVALLRSKYRIPIEIVSKVAGNRINKSYITRCKQGKLTHEKDRDYLIYDADVPEILSKLKSIDKALLIVSNPSIELWFLLHYKNVTARITTDECIKELNNRNKNCYQKGYIDKKLEEKLKEKCVDACKRAQALSLFENPSTNLYEFIEILEETSNQWL
jgi:hypothetical protein